MADTKFTHRQALPEEKMYFYSQSHLLDGLTGCLGHLRGDFGYGGKQFWHDWWVRSGVTLSPTFKEEFDDVVSALRADPEFAPLKDLSTMRKLCRNAPELESEFQSYGFRLDTDQQTYMLRCMTMSGNQNFYIYCYDRRTLEQHTEKAKSGIRFIDPHYKELFRLADGGYAVAHLPNGQQTVHSYRYVDDTHVEDNGVLFHICQLAEKNAQNGVYLEPALLEVPKETPKKPKSEPAR